MRRRRDYAVVVVLVAFLCIFRSIDSEGNRKLADNFLDRDNKSSWNLHHIDDDTAENLWIHCWNRLKERTGIVEGLEFYPFDEVSKTSGNTKLDRYLYVRLIIQKVISDLPSPEQKFISECLREEISQLDRLSGYGTVFSRLQENFSNWFTIPRRFLRNRKHHRRIIRPITGPAPAPALASAPSRGPSVAFSPNPAPMPSYQVPASSPAPIMLPPSPVIQPPTMAPELYAPGPSVIPTSSPTPSNTPIPKTQPHRPPKITTPTRSGNVDKDEKFIAVVSVGVVAGLGFLALFLFCLAKGRKTKVGPREDQMNGMSDGKPIFNVSSDDISADVKNFQSIGNSGSMLQNASGNGVQPPYPSGVTGAAPGNNHGSLPLPPGKSAPAPPAPPPPPPPKPPAPCPPPPPPKLVRPPPNPPKPGNKFRPSPLGPHRQDKNDEAEVSGDSGAQKPKLKPFFWEKVSANPDHSMVWHDIRAGSFQFNEEMIESLFGYSSADKNNNDNKKESSSYQSPPQFIRIIDAKKAQNLAILLKALNVTTEEVCDAVKEGNELPLELIHTLVKMAPTEEEEFKLRAFSGDVSLLGPAERFLKVMVDIPFAFKRLEALAFMSSFHEEVSSAVESFKTIEVACNELKNSRLFLKLLEAVLKTGNRMNVGTYRGGAQAFKLDTLLKLSDVKGTDGKTTLLLFVIQEIIRSEGVRAARRFRESESRVSESNNSLSSVKTEDLAEDSSSSSSSQDTEEYHRSLGLQVVSTLSAELANVRMAAVIDGDSLASTVSSLGQSLKKSKEFMKNEMSSIEEDSDFCSTLASFLNQAEIDIAKITEDEKRIMALVKKTGDYFHGNTGRDEGLRPFVIVRDFLIMVDKACKDLKNSRKQQQQPVRTPKKKRTLTNSSSSESRPDSTPDFQQRLFPAIKQRQIEECSFSSSSSSSSSPSAVSASSSDDDDDDDKLLTLHR